MPDTDTTAAEGLEPLSDERLEALAELMIGYADDDFFVSGSDAELNPVAVRALIAEVRASRRAPTPPGGGDDVRFPGVEHDKGNRDCLAKALPDEPKFIILGRDPDGARMVDLWADRREAAGGDAEHVDQVRLIAERMRAWRAAGHRPASAPEPDAYPPGAVTREEIIETIFTTFNAHAGEGAVEKFTDIPEELQVMIGEAADAVLSRLQSAREVRPGGAADVSTCFICGKPLVPGQRVLPDVIGEIGHLDCYGGCRDSFVKDIDTAEPLGPVDPLPEGYVWETDEHPAPRPGEEERLREAATSALAVLDAGEYPAIVKDLIAALRFAAQEGEPLTATGHSVPPGARAIHGATHAGETEVPRA